MKWSIAKKLLCITLMAIILPAIVGGVVLYREVEKNIGQTKLNDLMNVIDARYIHILDFLQSQKLGASFHGENHFLHQSLIEHHPVYGVPSVQERDESLKHIQAYLTYLQQNSKLGLHVMKQAKEDGVSLRQVFCRNVKWDMYRLDEPQYRYSEIFIIDHMGTVIASSNNKNIGANMSGSDLFKNDRHEVFVKDVYVDRDESTVMAFAAPVIEKSDYAPSKSDAENLFLGVVVLKVSTDFLTDLIKGDLGNLIGGKLFLLAIRHLLIFI